MQGGSTRPVGGDGTRLVREGALGLLGVGVLDKRCIARFKLLPRTVQASSFTFPVPDRKSS